MLAENEAEDPRARALRHEDEGRWAEAHAIVAERNDALSAWLHAYLHRVEGDIGNARYWYARAGRPPHSGALSAERDELAAAIRAAAVDPR